MSGVKGRSGRKSNAAVKSCRDGINAAVSPAQWHKIWSKLAAVAEEGNIQAARLLHEYCYGNPQPVPKPEPGPSPDSKIAYFLPKRPGEPIPPGSTLVEQDETLDAASRPAD